MCSTRRANKEKEDRTSFSRLICVAGRPFTPRDPAGKQLTIWSKQFKAADCRLQVQSAAKGWDFELSFPDTGFAPDKMGFDIVINDSGRKRVGAWSEFKESFCNRLGFGLIRFK